MATYQLFFQLIHVYTGLHSSFRDTPTEKEWEELYHMAVKQTLAGVLFHAIEKLPAEQRPPRPLLLQWFALTENIRKQNSLLNTECVRIQKLLETEGLHSVILKGQGVATYYPTPLLRTPGDIDLWIRAARKDTLAYAMLHNRNVDTCYLHTVFDISDITTIEAHFTPSRLNVPWRNHRLQHFFSQAKADKWETNMTLPSTTDTVCVPTPAFNRLYLLLHIYRHLFGEGIGLRQLMDYHYCLLQPFSIEENEETIRLLRQWGLLHFAGAVTWVVQQIFDTDAQHCFVSPKEQEGKFLLQEIMSGGNFGKYETRFKGIHSSRRLHRFCAHSCRNLMFARYHLGEVFWGVPWTIGHYMWRRWNGYL